MALEIERRFLVSDAGWRAHVSWQAELQQGYLLRREDGLTIRVRLQRPDNGEDRAWLTLKAMADASMPSPARLEFEYGIPVADAVALLQLASWQVSKTRHGLLLPGGDWVLDVFAGANAPLVIAEVELEHPDDTPPIPSWCGQEVTHLHQLSNAALAQVPWQSWSDAERNSLIAEATAAMEDQRLRRSMEL
jgi:CYTH domain-containing protein